MMTVKDGTGDCYEVRLFSQDLIKLLRTNKSPFESDHPINVYDFDDNTSSKPVRMAYGFPKLVSLQLKRNKVKIMGWFLENGAVWPWNEEIKKPTKKEARQNKKPSGKVLIIKKVSAEVTEELAKLLNGPAENEAQNEKNTEKQASETALVS